MAKMIDTQPDRVEQYASGRYLWYFTDGKDFLTLPVGSHYVVVHEPSVWFRRGRVILYETMKGPDLSTWTKVVKERELTADEIAHFEKLAGR